MSSFHSILCVALEPIPVLGHSHSLAHALSHLLVLEDGRRSCGGGVVSSSDGHSLDQAPTLAPDIASILKLVLELSYSDSFVRPRPTSLNVILF